MNTNIKTKLIKLNTYKNLPRIYIKIDKIFISKTKLTCEYLCESWQHLYKYFVYFLNFKLVVSKILNNNNLNIAISYIVFISILFKNWNLINYFQLKKRSLVWIILLYLKKYNKFWYLEDTWRFGIKYKLKLGFKFCLIFKLLTKITI